VPGVAAEQSYQLIGVTTFTRLAKLCGVIGLRCRGTSAHAAVCAVNAGREPCYGCVVGGVAFVVC
jgi:hypothetical protein